MFIKLKLFIVASVLALAGCAGLSGGSGLGSLSSESSAQAIYVVKGGYATALKAAVAYKELAPCSATVKVVCSDPKVVAQIQKADVLAFTAINTAQAAVDTIGGATASSAVGAARAALLALTTVISTSGVR